MTLLPKKDLLHPDWLELSKDIPNMNDFAAKMIEEIIEKRNQLVASRIYDLGIDLDFTIEKERRFKRFAIEIKGNETTYWFNDGTIEGQRIITFVDEQKPFDFTNGDVNISIEIKYY